ncbi:MAG: hypothetical protein ACK4M9_09670 [Anaerobacillus sp.]|uniref:hypothetical protein n=1 Tax=Anaerobacillus sp. TaxID=1872506 RepID=UPI00391D30B5
MGEKRICFAVLIHDNRELVKQLIDNIRHYCPNSLIVVYNGGKDRELLKDLDVLVCPTSRKLEYGYTTIYFIEIMEWLEEIKVEYDFLINIDSDALFIRKGYEEFIEKEMRDTDYMAVDYQVASQDYFCGIEIQKDRKRWEPFFTFNPLYGAFNVGQVMNRRFTKTLIKSTNIQLLKKALIETPAFGTDEIIFANLVKEFGLRAKCYPSLMQTKQSSIGYDMHNLLIRYRPYITICELISRLNEDVDRYLCHPIHRTSHDPARQLIMQLQKNNLKDDLNRDGVPITSKDIKHYKTSVPITSRYGNLEIVAIKENKLTHFYNENGRWLETTKITDDVTGTPLLFESGYGNFEVIAKSKKRGVTHWWRENNRWQNKWYGPTIITKENITPITVTQLEDNRLIVVGTFEKKLCYFLRDDGNSWSWTGPYF